MFLSFLSELALTPYTNRQC